MQRPSQQAFRSEPLTLSTPHPDSERAARAGGQAPRLLCGGGEAPARPRLCLLQELEAWTTDFALPTTVWLAGFFNPQSFLTAIMQSMARKNEWPLDKMCLSVEVTKKNREDMTAPPREGSYVYGLFMEGSWRRRGGSRGGGPCGLAQVCLLRAEASVQVPRPPQTQGHGGLAGHLLGAPCEAITWPDRSSHGGLKASTHSVPPVTPSCTK